LIEKNVVEVTASFVINVAQNLEDDSARFYNTLTKRFPENNKIFTTFAKESEKNKERVVRTYQETISDALEACFSFKGLNLNNYSVNTSLADNVSYMDALKKALELEKKASEFYMDVAKACSSLLTTISRVLKKVAETRKKRVPQLYSILDSLI